MRIDVFLKLSRLIPRRSVAQEMCDSSAIFVNDVEAKSSKDVMAGDEIEIRRKNRILRVRVESVPNAKQISKDAAHSLYAVIKDEAINQESP